MAETLSDIEALSHVGEALYGKQWQSDIARELQVDARRIRQWIKEDRPVPKGIRDDLIELLEKRHSLILQTLESLRSESPT